MPVSTSARTATPRSCSTRAWTEDTAEPGASRDAPGPGIGPDLGRAWPGHLAGPGARLVWGRRLRPAVRPEGAHYLQGGSHPVALGAQEVPLWHFLRAWRHWT